VIGAASRRAPAADALGGRREATPLDIGGSWGRVVAGAKFANERSGVNETGKTEPTDARLTWDHSLRVIWWQPW
jgi:hypothetical protein